MVQAERLTRHLRETALVLLLLLAEGVNTGQHLILLDPVTESRLDELTSQLTQLQERDLG
jgi:hypothetical protein